MSTHSCPLSNPRYGAGSLSAVLMTGCGCRSGLPKRRPRHFAPPAMEKDIRPPTTCMAVRSEGGHGIKVVGGSISRMSAMMAVRVSGSVIRRRDTLLSWSPWVPA